MLAVVAAIVVLDNAHVNNIAEAARSRWWGVKLQQPQQQNKTGESLRRDTS